MACDREMLTMISCWADGEATPQEASRASAHLEICPECRQMVKEWKEQRQLLEWAYTLELPEEVGMEVTQRADQPSAQSPLGNIFNALWRFKWAGIGVLASIVFAFIIHHFASMPRIPQLEAKLITGGQSQSVRMGDNVLLKLGTYSKITRVDDRSIRLENGWVNASVTNGSGLRILTRRIEVVDQGTRFHVGTGSKMDYVSVEEGSVSVTRGETTQQVNAGQALFAQDGKEMEIADLFKTTPEDSIPGTPLDEEHGVFTPRTAEDLDWYEGLNRLASKFPDARLDTGSRISSGDSLSHAVDKGLRNGLRTHFTDIAQAMAGGLVDSGEWAVPVGVIRVRGVTSSPELRDDTYYVQLVPKDGSIVWRFSGSMGEQVDIPLEFEKRNGITGFTSVPIGTTGTYYCDGRDADVTMVISDWPEKSKPVFKIKMRDKDESKNQKEKRTMLTEALAGFGDIEFNAGGISDLLYLDQERKHSLLIAWNNDAGKELCRVSDQLKQGRGGSAVLAVLSSDTSLADPETDSGAYLLKFVQSDPSGTPHLEIAGASSYELRRYKLKVDKGGGHGWTPESLEGYGTVDLSYTPYAAENGVFAFRFEVVGCPEDRSTRRITHKTKHSEETTRKQPTGTWAEGWIKVRKS